MSNSSHSTLVGGRSRSSRNGMIEIRFRPHRAWWVQLLLAVWRWRTELATVAAGLIAYAKLTDRLGATGADITVLVALTVAFGLPWSRHFLVARFWCVVTRHRIRLFAVEAGVYNRSGRLPAIWWIRPTRVGERAWLVLPPGLSAADLEDRLDRLAATCWARDARVSPVRSMVALVCVDIVRRDPLTGRKPRPITNPLTRRPAAVPDGFTAAHTPPPDDTTGATAGVEPSPGPSPHPSPTAIAADRAGDVPPDGLAVLVNGEDVSDYVDL